jgi:hypothetical protein
MKEWIMILLDAGILLFLVFTWFYEGHHRRCTIITKCPNCGTEGAVTCHSKQLNEEKL